MILYHFTAEVHLSQIINSGFLKTVESNISGRRSNAGPDVVWLTSDPDRNGDSHGLSGSSADKTVVRFTVDVPDSDVEAWIPWSRKRYITKVWASAFEADKRPDQWFVVERPILKEEWLDIEVADR